MRIRPHRVDPLETSIYKIKDALQALRLVANIAHYGGWVNLSDEEYNVAIRRITSPYWDRGLTEAEGRAMLNKALKELEV